MTELHAQDTCSNENQSVRHSSATNILLIQPRRRGARTPQDEAEAPAKAAASAGNLVGVHHARVDDEGQEAAEAGQDTRDDTRLGTMDNQGGGASTQASDTV